MLSVVTPEQERRAAAATAEALSKAVKSSSKPAKHPKWAFLAAVQASRELKGNTKVVAMLLAEFVSEKDGYAYPTLDQIMAKRGLPETTVKRALRNIQDRKVTNPETGEETVIPGWFKRVPTKSSNGGDYRNHWFPNYSRAGISEVKGGGGQNEPLGGQIDPRRGPSAAPHIVTMIPTLDDSQRNNPDESQEPGLVLQLHLMM